MSTSPPRGWAKLQAALLADVRAFNPSSMRPVQTVVTSLSGTRCVERVDKLRRQQQEDDAEDDARRQLAIQKLALVRSFANADKEPCCVLEGLYVGSIGAARNLRALEECNVRRVLNASPVVPCFHRNKLRYMVVQVYDDPSADIAQHFDTTNEYIARGLRKGGVLVHCYAGQSRSTTLVMAYLIGREKCTLYEAWERVRRARPATSPNSGFMQQLRDYARRLGRDRQPQQHCSSAQLEEPWEGDVAALPQWEVVKC